MTVDKEQPVPTIRMGQDIPANASHKNLTPWPTLEDEGDFEDAFLGCILRMYLRMHSPRIEDAD